MKNLPSVEVLEAIFTKDMDEIWLNRASWHENWDANIKGWSENLNGARWAPQRIAYPETKGRRHYESRLECMPVTSML